MLARWGPDEILWTPGDRLVRFAGRV